MTKYRLACTLTILGSIHCLSIARGAGGSLTTHAEMIARLTSLADADSRNHHRLAIASIGKSVKGKDIILATISDQNSPPGSTKRLFVICRQHGNEPATTEAMLSLITQLVQRDDPQTADLLSKVTFYIVPMVNPDGADSFVRRNAGGVDLNRDWLDLSQPETAAVRARIDEICPDVLIDQHELSPSNRTTDFVESAGLVSGATDQVVAECGRIQELVIGILRTHDMTVRSCRIEDHSPPRLAHRYFPILGGTKTLLFETRQAGERKYRLEYRKELHITATMTVAKYLAGQEDLLRQRIAEYDASRRWVQLASRGSLSNKPRPSITRARVHRDRRRW